MLVIDCHWLRKTAVPCGSIYDCALCINSILIGKDVLSFLHILVVLPSGYKHLHAFLRASSEAAELLPPLIDDM